MEAPRPLTGAGALGTAAGILLCWYAFERRMCTMPGGIEVRCAPNVAYLVPGFVFVVLGIGLLLLAYRRSRPGHTATESA